MIPRIGLVFLKVAAMCVFAAGGFVAIQLAMRRAEADMALSLVRMFGTRDVYDAGGTTLLVVPNERAAFHVLITPSCSSIASVIAFLCLTLLVPSRMAVRNVAALTAAAGLVVGGNVVRIAGSLAIGVVAGRGSLVLFHDWVGSMFTVICTLIGYVVMLRFLLPRDHEMPVTTRRELVAHAP